MEGCRFREDHLFQSFIPFLRMQGTSDGTLAHSRQAQAGFGGNLGFAMGGFKLDHDDISETRSLVCPTLLHKFSLVEFTI